MFVAGVSHFLELYYRKIFSNFEHDIGDHKLNLASSRMQQLDTARLLKTYMILRSDTTILNYRLEESSCPKVTRGNSAPFFLSVEIVSVSQKETMLISILCANFRWKGIFDKCAKLLKIIILSRKRIFRKGVVSELAGKSKRSKTTRLTV